MGLLVPLLPPGWPVVVGIDETVEERRQGRKIKAKGRYRDAVRSTDKAVVKCYGLKWISLMLLVPLPWKYAGVGAALFDGVGAVVVGKYGCRAAP